MNTHLPSLAGLRMNPLPLRRRAAALLAMAALLPAAGCGGGGDGGGTPPVERVVASVEVASPAPTVAAGGTVQLSATAFDASRAAIGGKSFTWSSSSDAVATVGGGGLVTGRAEGPVTITARETGTGITGSVQLTVTRAPVGSVVLSHAALSVQAGAAAQLTATVRDAQGNPLAGREVAWSSANGAVAIVSQTGVVTGVAVGGPVDVVASSEGRADTARVTVTPVAIARVDVSPAAHTVTLGSTVALSATPRDAAGNALAGRTVVWASASPAVATVDPATGMVTGVAAGGPVAVTATAEGVTGTSQITVSPLPVATVEVIPGTATVEVQKSVGLAAIARSAGGTVLTGRRVTWESADPSVAAVDPSTGQVWGLAPGGPVQVTATVEGQTASALVTVVPIPVVRVDVTPPSASIQVGATVALTALARSATGAVLTGRAVAWRSDDIGVAAVDPATGVVTGMDVGGPVRVIGTVEGKADTAFVTVSPAPVASVVVTPEAATLNPGQTVDLEAAARDARGSALSGRVIAWRTTAPSVATVDAGTGLVRAVAPGSAMVIGTVEGRADTARITVVLVPVGGVRVTPDAVTLEALRSTTLSATVRDAAGNVLNDRRVVWTTTNPAIATMDFMGSGTVTGVAPGTVDVIASVEGRADTTRVTVTRALATSVWLSPDFQTLNVGQTKSVALTAYRVNSTIMPNPAATWTVTPGGVVSLAAAVPGAQVTGTAPGLAGIVGQVDNANDSSWVAVLGPQTPYSTFTLPGVTDRIRLSVFRNQTLTIPVVLDLSRASATGDLGAAQFELRYDPAVFTFQSAASPLAGSPNWNIPTPGVFKFSFAGTDVQTTGPRLTLVNLTFKVGAAVPFGTRRAMSLVYTEAPSRTGLSDYQMPVVVTARFTVISGS